MTKTRNRKRSRIKSRGRKRTRNRSGGRRARNRKRSRSRRSRRRSSSRSRRRSRRRSGGSFPDSYYTERGLPIPISPLAASMGKMNLAKKKAEKRAENKSSEVSSTARRSGERAKTKKASRMPRFEKSKVAAQRSAMRRKTQHFIDDFEKDKPAGYVNPLFEQFQPKKPHTTVIR